MTAAADGSYQACIDAVKAALGDNAADNEVEQIAVDLQKRAEGLRNRDPLLSDTEAVMQAARDLGDEARLAALVEKRWRAINVLRKQQRFARYTAQQGREARAAQELMVGSQEGLYGAARSVDSESHALEAELIGPMLHEIRQAGLQNLIRKGGRNFDRDVARELFRLPVPTLLEMIERKEAAVLVLEAIDQVNIGAIGFVTKARSGRTNEVWCDLEMRAPVDQAVAEILATKLEETAADDGSIGRCSMIRISADGPMPRPYGYTYEACSDDSRTMSRQFGGSQLN